MKALEKKGTWEIVKWQRGKKSVGCRWIYVVKHKSNDTIDFYMAKIVTTGYTRTYGIRYGYTFAQGEKMNIIISYNSLWLRTMSILFKKILSYMET